MAGKNREIKRRIKSVKNTHQITKAMEMVSSAKFKRFNTLVMNSRPYSVNLEKILQNIAAGVKNENHPLFIGRENVKRIALVVVASDRGLCGSYNNTILKEMVRFVKSHHDKNVSIVAVGRKVRDYCRKHEFDMKAEYIQLVPESMFETSKLISENIVDFYFQGIFDEVHIMYSKFESAVNSTLTISQMIPVKKSETKQEKIYLFEPNEERIIESLLPKYLSITIYQNLLEATASEHSARMRAMSSASDNADEMIGKLNLQYNRARQASITQELSEIVGGADALK